jgi:hypothetical protein
MTNGWEDLTVYEEEDIKGGLSSLNSKPKDVIELFSFDGMKPI